MLFCYLCFNFTFQKSCFLAGILARVKLIEKNNYFILFLSQRQPNFYMPPNQFAGYVFWPRDKFYYSGGRSKDFNKELNDFLGRED